MNIKESTLRKHIRRIIRECLMEGRYSNTAVPTSTRLSNTLDTQNGHPMGHESGNHSARDYVQQASTFDINGQRFVPSEYVQLSVGGFIKYCANNFGKDMAIVRDAMLKFKEVDADPKNKKIGDALLKKANVGTISLFKTEKDMRNTIDVVNGGAYRNGRKVIYRIVTCKEIYEYAKRIPYSMYGYWEFSLDGGDTWYIFKPEPIIKKKESTIG